MLQPRNPSTEPHRRRSRHEAFVVIGDELAAGAGPFGLTRDHQKWSFPTQAVSRLGLPFRQANLPSEGMGRPVGSIPGGPSQGVSLLAPPIRPGADPSPPTLVALPGIGFHEAVHRRISQPLVGLEPNQDLFNLALGLPALLDGRRALTPVEMAASLQPESALISLGYHEACSAAAALDPALLPSATLVEECLEQACATLGPCRRILATVPNPLHSTFFLSRDRVGHWWQVEPEELSRRLNWLPDHLIPASALGSIKAHLAREGSKPRASDPPIAFLAPTLAAELREGLDAINHTIRDIADRDKAWLLDLESLFQRLAKDGLSIEGQNINADPGGGFFSLTSFLPGPVGHGIIAEMLVELLEAELDAGESPVQKTAWGPLFEADKALELDMATFSSGETKSQDSQQISKSVSKQVSIPDAAPTDERSLPSDPTDLVESDELLPGQELIFELDNDGGCLDRSLEVKDSSLVFGGPAISRCEIAGRLRLCLLSEIQEDSIDSETQTETARRTFPWVRFELRFDPELEVEAGPLSAPFFWRQDLPAGRLNGTWTGRLHRHSLEIRDLHLDAVQSCPFRNRLLVLCPEPPEESLNARLELSRNAEDLLQLSLSISWITEWGRRSPDSGARIPWLPDALPDSEGATKPTICVGCRRVTLSQRLSLRATEPTSSSHEIETLTAESKTENREHFRSPLIPRSFLELTSFSHDSQLSASASIDAPPVQAKVKWGHPLLGRWVLQSGEPTGDRLPILIHPLPFGTYQGPGWLGFESEVRFGKQIYPQPAIRLSPPTHSLNMCAVDQLSGVSIGPFELALQDDRRLLTDLHKLLAPRRSMTMAYRGSARLETKSGGDTYFVLSPLSKPDEIVPFETLGGHPKLRLRPSELFPAPHGASGYPVQTESRLDFNLRLAAGRGLEVPSGKLSGEERLLSSTRRLFSYRYMLSTRASDPATFELIDHTLGGTFVLKHLAHIVFGSSPSSRARRTPDTVTFSGFGTWSLDPESGPTHRISAQLCRSRHSPFIAIAIDEGETASICTGFCP